MEGEGGGLTEEIVIIHGVHAATSIQLAENLLDLPHTFINLLYRYTLHMPDIFLV